MIAPSDSAIAGTDKVLRLNEFLKSGRLPQPQGGVAVTLNGGVPAAHHAASIVRTPPNNRNEQPLFFDPGVTTPYMSRSSSGSSTRSGRTRSSTFPTSGRGAAICSG